MNIAHPSVKSAAASSLSPADLSVSQSVKVWKLPQSNLAKVGLVRKYDISVPLVVFPYVSTLSPVYITLTSGAFGYSTYASWKIRAESAPVLVRKVDLPTMFVMLRVINTEPSLCFSVLVKVIPFPYTCGAYVAILWSSVCGAATAGAELVCEGVDGVWDAVPVVAAADTAPDGFDGAVMPKSMKNTTMLTPKIMLARFRVVLKVVGRIRPIANPTKERRKRVRNMLLMVA